MNIEDIQPLVASWIAEIPELSGVTILEDDGTYPKMPPRESALRTKGLCVTVSQVQSEGTVDVSDSGVCSHTVWIGVAIEENVTINRNTGGTLQPAEKILRLILDKVSGQPRNSTVPSRSILPASPPFNNLGLQGGVLRVVANFNHVNVIKPS